MSYTKIVGAESGLLDQVPDMDPAKKVQNRTATHHCDVPLSSNHQHLIFQSFSAHLRV